MTNLTSEIADKLLEIGDEFLADWAIDCKNEPAYQARKAEWDALRPIFVAAPDLLENPKQPLVVRTARRQRLLKRASVAGADENEYRHRKGRCAPSFHTIP